MTNNSLNSQLKRQIKELKKLSEAMAKSIEISKETEVGCSQEDKHNWAFEWRIERENTEHWKEQLEKILDEAKN